MKIETRRKKWLHNVYSFLMSISGRMMLTFPRCINLLLIIIVSFQLSMLTYGCSTSVTGGTSTEVVGVVSGKIVTPDNRELEGVPVYLFDQVSKYTNSFEDTIADTTDINGNFLLHVDSSGHYLLEVKDTMRRSFLDEILITDDKQTLSLGLLKVDTMGSLSGHILDEYPYNDTTKGLEFRIILYKKDMPFKYQWIPNRGSFMIDSLAPGEVRLQVLAWIIDYSRANKRIVFLDSTIQIIPGKNTVLDTVIINKETLINTDGFTMNTDSSIPIHCNGSDYTLMLSIDSFTMLNRCVYSFACSPAYAKNILNKTNNKAAQLFTSDILAGAAVSRFDRSEI